MSENVLDSAEAAMQASVDMGTNGLRLTGNIRAAVDNINTICAIWEGMDESYANNLTLALGKEGVIAANDIYLVFKQGQVMLKEKGL